MLPYYYTHQLIDSTNTGLAHIHVEILTIEARRRLKGKLLIHVIEIMALELFLLFG